MHYLYDKFNLVWLFDFTHVVASLRKGVCSHVGTHGSPGHDEYMLRSYIDVLVILLNLFLFFV